MTPADALAADMLATARALAALGVHLPVMYVPDKGQPVYSCGGCGAEMEDDRDCPDCGEGDVDRRFPDAQRIPDLSRVENGDAMLALLREAEVEYFAGWVLPDKSHERGGHYVSAGCPPQRSPHLAHAAAKAWLMLLTAGLIRLKD